MNLISHRFGHAIFLCALPLLPLTAHAQPAPPNTTVEIPPPPKRAPQVFGGSLPTVTWDELQKELGGPSLVTLHAEKMPLLQIIEELNRQTPIPVSAYIPPNWEKFDGKLFSANYDNQPFWKVVRDMAQQMQIGLSNSSSNSGVEFLYWSPEPDALTATSGPCIFALSDVEHHRTLRSGTTKAENALAEETLFLKGRFFVDPKVRWQSSELSVKVETALDENGTSLVAETDSDSDPRHSASNPTDLSLELKPPAKRPDGTRSSQLKTLRGSLHGVVALQRQQWEVEDALNIKNAEKTFGSEDDAIRIEIQDVKKVNDDYQVVLIVSQSKSNQEGQLRYVKLATGKGVVIGSSFYRDVQLLDDKNRPLQQVKIGSQRDGDRETSIVTITLTFRPQKSDDENLRTGTPAKVVLNYNSDYRELVVPFEFKDIALP